MSHITRELQSLNKYEERVREAESEIRYLETWASMAEYRTCIEDAMDKLSIAKRELEEARRGV